jgi:hypothetical protein
MAAGTRVLLRVSVWLYHCSNTFMLHADSMKEVVTSLRTWLLALVYFFV